MSSTTFQAVGFFIVSLAGLCIDIGLAWAINGIFDVALWQAAVCGFFSATVFNYLVNSKWTFRDADKQPSVSGLIRYFLVIGISLVIRLGMLQVLMLILPFDLQYPPIILFIAAGTSFIVSFMLARLFVFK